MTLAAPKKHGRIYDAIECECGGIGVVVRNNEVVDCECCGGVGVIDRRAI